MAVTYLNASISCAGSDSQSGGAGPGGWAGGGGEELPEQLSHT